MTVNLRSPVSPPTQKIMPHLEYENDLVTHNELVTLIIVTFSIYTSLIPVPVKNPYSPTIEFYPIVEFNIVTL